MEEFEVIETEAWTSLHHFLIELKMVAEKQGICIIFENHTEWLQVERMLSIYIQKSSTQKRSDYLDEVTPSILTSISYIAQSYINSSLLHGRENAEGQHPEYVPFPVFRPGHRPRLCKDRRV